MKKLVSFLLVITASALVFTSCSEEEEAVSTNLNTDSSYVGQLYGENGIVNSCDEAQGIIFAVSPDGQTAYLVAFTDILEAAEEINEETGERLVKVYSGPTPWSTRLFETGAKSADGEANTDLIIKVMEATTYNVHYYDPETQQFKDSVTSRTPDTATAARLCRNYFKRDMKGEETTRANWRNEKNWKWAAIHKGKWYLPSREELAALMKVREKINDLYLTGDKTDYMNENGFIAIGGTDDFALWSSTEYNQNCAWYDLPASTDDNYLKKDFSNEGGMGRMYVRPIRKVQL